LREKPHSIVVCYCDFSMQSRPLQQPLCGTNLKTTVASKRVYESDSSPDAGISGKGEQGTKSPFALSSHQNASQLPNFGWPVMVRKKAECPTRAMQVSGRARSQVLKCSTRSATSFSAAFFPDTFGQYSSGRWHNPDQLDTWGCLEINSLDGVPVSDGIMDRSHIRWHKHFGTSDWPKISVAVCIVRESGETTMISNGRLLI